MKKEITPLDEEQITEEQPKPMLHEGHKLVTRRDFLAQGFLGMSALTLMPTLTSLFSSSAHAATCNLGPVATGLTPVIIIDLAGGAAMAGSNFMVGGPGGQLDFLPDYSRLGLPQDFHPSRPNMLNTEMGVAFHGDSGFLRGIQQVTSQSTRQSIDGTVICTATSDDTSNNQINPIFWLHKAGARGQLVQLAGTSSRNGSGGYSMPPIASVDMTVAPVILNRPQDALNLVSVGRLNSFANVDQGFKVDRVMETVAALSKNKIDALPERSISERLKKILGCGFEQSSEQIKQFSPDVLDPGQDPDVLAAFGSDFNSNSNRRKSATLSKLVLDGYIGAATIQMGGYDYHDGTRSRGEIRDIEAGQIIGRIFELAARKRKDVVVMVLTDGACSTNRTVDNSVDGRGKFIWTGDSGVRTATAMMVYKHGGKPKMRRENRQVGHYKENGSIETAALNVSNSQINLAKLLVANYMALHGNEGNLAQVVGDDPFRLDLDNYLLFDKLR